MYYEESLIDGAWYWRGTPTGDWLPMGHAKLAEKIAALQQSLTAGEQRPSNDQIVAQVLLGVCELPDYNSPDDQPELLQCTTKELELVVRRALGEDP